MYEYEGIIIHWLGHDAFWLEAKGLNIYFDPYKLGKSSLPKADIIITTHDHFDHLNVEAINMISNEESVLIGPKVCQEKLATEVNSKKEVLELNPGGTVKVSDIKISAIPAYNFHRFRDPKTKTPFHPKEAGHIGPILDIDGIIVYHAGDTDKIVEMQNLKPHIALIPISGTYVMDVPEAVEAAREIDAQVTIPMHVGRGIGELSFIEDFQQQLPELEIAILDLEED